MSAPAPLAPRAIAPSVAPSVAPTVGARLHQLRRAAAEASRAAEQVLGPLGLDVDEHALLAAVSRGESPEDVPAVSFRLLMRGLLTDGSADDRLHLTGRGDALLREADARLEALPG